MEALLVIGLLELDISIPDSRSLKDKRSVIRSVKDRTVHRMNVSVAEVGQQDVWKHAQLAFVTVAATRAVVDKRLSELSVILQGNPRYVVLDLRTEQI